MSQKFGFWWFNEGGLCNGEQHSRRQAWWGDRSFYMETLRVFLGAEPIPQNARLDLNVQIGHSDGSLIDVVWADRYQQSAGVSDVCALKTFVTPWEFAPGSALIVTPYAMGPMVNGVHMQWGIAIMVEGVVR